MLNNIYAHHVDLNINDFLLANLIILFISIIAVGFKVIKAATANPVKTLVEL
jgi:hypothetical protein